MKKKYLATSDTAFKILESIKDYEKYSKEIAEDINSTRMTVSSFLKELRNSELVKRGKRNKAQYYKITEKGKEYIEKRKEIRSKLRSLKNFLKR